MPRSVIARIREKVRLHQYDMTAHAIDEMAEDYLDIEDIEQVILKGHIAKTEHDDPRGTKYVIEGTGVDGLTPVAVVGRFTTTGRYLIVTVYAVNGS